MRVKAIVAYDGTGYQGFQRQANGPTVQEALEGAVARVTGRQIGVLAAGRTDTGVHATGQVIAFDTDWRHSLVVLQRALNAVLPPDVAVSEIEEVHPDFHPRFDALSREYRYTIYNAAVRAPLVQRTSLFFPKQLGVTGMQEAAQMLVGEHDFASFGRPPQGDSTVRRVLRAEWNNVPPWLTLDIEANAFLYRMVRLLVGTMIQVGLGKVDVQAFGRILAARDQRRAGPAVAPQGLCLVRVNYQSDSR